MDDADKEKYRKLNVQLEIDLVTLGDDLMRMPSITQEAAELAAKYADVERVARHAYDVVKSGAANRLGRANPAKPPSEAQITSEIPLVDDVQDARNQYDIAQFDAQITSELLKSFRDKRHALETISTMINTGFITPSAVYDRSKQERKQLG